LCVTSCVEILGHYSSSYCYTPLRIAWPYLFTSYFPRYFLILIRSSLSLLFPRLNRPRFFSLSSYGQCSKPFSIFEALCLLNWGVQNRTQYYKCGRTKGRMSSFALSNTNRIPLAFLTTRADCWLMANLLSTSTPSSFSIELISSSLVALIIHKQNKE